MLQTENPKEQRAKRKERAERRRERKIFGEMRGEREIFRTKSSWYGGVRPEKY